jgi:hypothetical protein
MSGSEAGTLSGMVVLVVGLLLGGGPRAQPQDSDDAAAPPKSVYGKLERVDRIRNTIIMESDSGEKLEWRIDKKVMAEAATFEAGDPMIVIYRLLPTKVKRVTALAFPGKEDMPTYVNRTGDRVVLRSAPPVDGACDKAGGGSVTESLIPPGGRAQAMEACWCCAASGETCAPTTKTGLGRAFLVQCFK